MSEIILKYNLLDDLGKQEVQDFIEFLLNKGRKKAESISAKSPPKMEEPKEETFMEKYRKNLLEVSVWTDEDVAVFEENRKKFNEWTVEEW